MGHRKTVLIVIDGVDSTQTLAKQISGALAEHKVTVRSAASFVGTDLLSAQVFFIGCEKAGPPSFVYLAEMLRHINLAGRPCGVFAANGKALEYLVRLVKNSEAALGEPLLTPNSAIKTSALKKWLKTIIDVEVIV